MSTTKTVPGVVEESGTVTEPLLERDAELSELRSLADTTRTGSGRVAVIEGSAGIGKSRLLEQAIAHARGHGARILHARGGELEQDLGWRVVRELFEPTLNEETLFSGAARLALPALGRPDHAAGLVDVAGSSLHGLYWLTSNLGERSPLVIAVDDAQWADAPSLRFLLYLAQRVEDLPLLIVIAARPPGRGENALPIRSLAARAAVIRPAALSEAASGQLTSRALGAEPDPEFAQTSHELTRGNPFLVHELNVSLARDDVVPSAENSVRIRAVRPEAVRSAVLVRLASLSEEDRSIAEAVAVLGDLVPLRSAAELARIDEEAATRAVERLARADILAEALPLEFVHPITRSVIYEDISPARRSRLHRGASQLAGERADPETVAHHLLAAEPRADPAVAESLELAAGAAFGRGAPDAAATYLRRALAEPSAEERRGPVLAALGQAEAAIGDDRARDRVAEALELVDDPVERAELQLRLGLIYYASAGPREAAEVFRRGREELGADSSHPIGAALTTSYVAMATLIGLISVRELEELIDSTHEPPPGPVGPAEREILIRLALAHVHGGRSYERAGDLALRALAGGTMLAEQGVSLSFSVGASCVVWADALAPGEEIANDALEHSRRVGDTITAAYALFGRAQPRYWRGAVADAAADAGAAVDAWRGGWGMALAHAAHWQAVALVELDRAEEADRILEASPPRGAEIGVHDGSWRMGRARVALARGEPRAAREELRVVEEIAVRAPFYGAPGYWPWRADAAIAAGLDGDEAEAARLVEDALTITRRCRAPRPLGCALRAAGLVAGGEEGAGSLRESVRVLERSPAKLELCRSMVDLGALLRRNGERREGQAYLRRGLDLAHRLGALALERRAREELVRTGARPRRERLSGPEALTPSERRVTELAAEGRTNREIAELLFVSLRTVETHLTHAYSKLDISSRGGLAAALRRE